MAIHCPHCASSIDAAAESCGELLCPSCGSSLRADQERTRTYVAEHRHLGKFELIEQVGSGAFGTVWRARDTELGRIVAIKIPQSGLLASDKEAQRFDREARSAAQLRHPGIVTLHEVGRFENLPYLVSDFIQGLTLTEYLEAHRPSHRDSAELVAQVAEALDYAHAMGVVHRDVKPSNIMLERGGSGSGSGSRSGTGLSGSSGRPLLMDFGLALRADVEATMTQEGEILGTPAYMSPEQAAGQSHKVDARSDVYSLGVVLYRLLTGQLPFQGNARVILDQLLNDEPAPPRKLDRTVARDLETICLKAMAKTPANRYPTARAFAEDLRRYLANEPIAARPVAAWERVWRWGRRRPAAAAAVGLGGLAALTLVGLTVALGYQARLRSAFADADRQRTIAQENSRIADRESSIAKEQRQIAETNLNHNRFVVAERELLGNNVRRTVQLLAEIPEEHRGWEWHYLNRQCHGELQPLRGHTDQVWGLAYSPDGRLIASASYDGSVRIWEAELGIEVRKFPISGWCYIVRFAPDGRWLAAATGIYGQPHEICIWDVANGAKVPSLQGHTGALFSLDVSPDGRYLASGDSDGVIKLWDTATWRLLRTLGPVPEGISYLAFHPDGAQLATVLGKFDGFASQRNGVCLFWDVATGQQTRRLESRAGSGSVQGLAFQPDGARLAASCADGSVRIWDLAQGHEERVLRGHTQYVSSVAFSADGQRVASSSDDGTARIWDATDGEQLLVLRGHSGPVNRVAFRPDGKRLVTAGADGMVKVWSATTTTGVLTLREEGYPVCCAVFSPDGQIVASAHRNGGIGLWDSHTGQRIQVLRSEGLPAWCVAFSPDGRFLASAAGDHTRPEEPGELLIWDLLTGRVSHVLEGITTCVWTVTYSRDGRWLASSGGETSSGPGELKLWDAASGRLVRSFAVSRETGIHRVAFSPDAMRLAAAQGDGSVTLWDSSTARADGVLKGHHGIVLDVQFDRSGHQLLTAGYDQTIRLWDLDGPQAPRILREHANSVQRAVFSPDGRRIASASWDQTIKLWDAANGQELLTLRGHTGYVWSVAFSPDGRRLASASFDGTIKIWDARPLEDSEPTTP